MQKKPGAQAGNHNALRHGAYLARFDGRTVLGRAQRQVKAIRCKILEHEILTGNRTPTLEKHYLRWARELREDLKALGLKRQAEPIPTLGQYLQEHYAEN